MAATFYWDQDGDTTIGTGGTGAWDTTSSFWRAISDVGVLGTYGNNTSDAVVLGGTAGTLTIAAGGVNVNNLTFLTTGYTIAGGANALTLSGTAPTIDTGTGSQTISAAVAGTSGFTKLGSGTLTLSTTTNTWTGNAIINAGTLNVNIGQAASAGFVLGNGDCRKRQYDAE